MKAAKDDIFRKEDDRSKQMKKMADVYFKNREMSVQEAVFRVCSLRMKDSTRNVNFIPTDEHATRISLPLRQVEALAKSGDTDTSIWMSNIIDKYKARPHSEEFNKMCMAQFASEFRILPDSQQIHDSKNEFILSNNMGKIKRRSKSK